MKRLLNSGFVVVALALLAVATLFTFTFRRPFGAYDWFGAGKKIYGRCWRQQASDRRV